MTSAYKWRIDDIGIIYLTDENGGESFIDPNERIVTSDEDIEISNYVANLTKEQYETLFNAMKVKYDTVSFLPFEYYYDIQEGDCVICTATNGKDGRDGKDGLDGQDGKDGQNGKDGESGKDGKDGIDGKDGKNGSTIEEIIGADENNIVIIKVRNSDGNVEEYTVKITTPIKEDDSDDTISDDIINRIIAALNERNVKMANNMIRFNEDGTIEIGDENSVKFIRIKPDSFSFDVSYGNISNSTITDSVIKDTNISNTVINKSLIEGINRSPFKNSVSNVIYGSDLSGETYLNSNSFFISFDSELNSSNINDTLTHDKRDNGVVKKYFNQTLNEILFTTNKEESWFQENGLSAKKLRLNPREYLEMVGFNSVEHDDVCSYMVVKRIPYQQETGGILNVLCAGSVKFINNGSNHRLDYEYTTFNGNDFIDISYSATGIFKVTQNLTSPYSYIPFVTGVWSNCNNAGSEKILKANLDNITSKSFNVILSDDSSLNNGGFNFIMYANNFHQGIGNNGIFNKKKEIKI